MSETGRCNNPHRWTQFLIDTVVPSSMNPVGEEGNLFSALFDKVPAKRAGNEDDIAGTVLYLVSRAGVSLRRPFGACPFPPCGAEILTILSRPMWMEYRFALTEAAFCLPMVKNDIGYKGNIGKVGTCISETKMLRTRPYMRLFFN